MALTNGFVFYFAATFFVAFGSRRWFGPNNSLQCNCADHIECTESGCATPFACSGYQVGPRCQYLDALALQKMMLLGRGPNPPWLSGNERECAPGDFDGNIHIGIDDMAIAFTWLRLVFDTQSPTPHGITITLLDADDRINTANVAYDMYTLQEGKSFLFRSKVSGLKFSKMKLTNVPKNLCKMELSTGRDVATRQRITQSSVKQYVEQHSSEHCNMTQSKAVTGKMGWWEVHLKRPVVVVAHYIIGFRDLDIKREQCPLYRFRLTAKHGDSVVYQIDIDNTAIPGFLPPSIIGIKSNLPVSSIRIEAVSLKGSPVWHKASFCEGQISVCRCGIMAENDCPPNHAGFDCEPCDNCVDEICDITLGCMHGCVEGYKGHMCREECSPNYSGSECSMPCSATCKTPHCHHITGHCIDGCQHGYYGPTCKKECNPNCMKGEDGVPVCDQTDGSCIGCDENYGGTFCLEKNGSSSAVPNLPMLFVTAGSQVVLFVIS